MADQIFQVNSCSFQDTEISASLRAGPGIIIDFRQATTVTGSFTGTGVGLTNVSASFIIQNPTTTASWASNAQTASNVTSSNVIGKVSSAINADTASNVTASNIVGKVSSAVNADTASFVTLAQTASFITTAQTASLSIFANAFTASQGERIGPTGDPARLHITASDTANIPLFEIDGYNQNKIFVVDATGSMSATGSLQGTASYSGTSSISTTRQTFMISGSDFTTTLSTATATPLSFSVNPGEAWTCDAYLTIQNSSNKGTFFAVNSNAGVGGSGSIEGNVFSSVVENTAFASERIDSANVLTTTKFLTTVTAATPTMTQFHFSVTNPATSSLYSIAVGQNNAGNTITVFKGSYLTAVRII